MTGSLRGRQPRVAALVTAAVVVLAATAGAAGAQRAAECSDAPYALELGALTGPRGADLAVHVTTATGCALVAELKKVQLKTYGADGALTDVRNLTDVAAPGGKAVIALPSVERGRRVEADVLVQPGSRTHVLRQAATTRLRPDLVVSAVNAPAQTTTSRPIDVVVDVAERNGDTGAAAKVTLAFGGTTLGPVDVTVAPGGSASATFPGVRFAAAEETTLVSAVVGVAPEETDDRNNTGSGKVDVTEHELAVSNVLVPSLGGYGAQFNQHVYSPAPLTNLPAAAFPDLEDKVKAFEPQLVRIFYNDDWEELRATAPQNLESFYRTVALAHEAGATINITYHTAARARLQPGAFMARFANVLEELVRRRGLTNVRWVTVQNEPNTPGLALTLTEWHALYRALHDELVARALRDHIHLMGGDLVESAGARDHALWYAYMNEHMLDIVDAHSEHIYWNYFDVGRFMFRLRDVRKLVVEDTAVEKRRPSYIMEFGVRGHGTAPGKPPLQFAYYEDGTELRRTNLAAFQQLWFNIASAQLGFTGTSKWDLYWGLYDGSSRNNQSYWMMNPTESGTWELFPTFHALRLMLRTTERGWRVVRVEPWAQDDWDPLVQDQPEKELVTYIGPNGQLTVLGLDSGGRLLNGASPELRTYSLGGLSPNTNLTLALWNATGDGTNSIAGTVPTNAAGVARFQVPLHAAFALTTLPID